jgi:hypothetical protein
MSYQDKLEELQRLRAEVRRLEAAAEREAKSMSPVTIDDEHRMRADQATFDPAYQAANRRAPPPLGHERPREYARRLAEGLRPLSPRWASHGRLAEMPDDVFAIAADQIRSDAIAHGPTAGLAPGQIKERETRSSAGHVVKEFVGEDAHFTQQFARPARRAVFHAPEFYQDAARTAALSRLSERVWHRPMVSAPSARF